MAEQVLTAVTAQVDADREQELVSGFHEITSGPTPDGLLRSELVRGQSGHWQILTLWRDRAALDAMRSSGDPPAAPQLFRRVGAEPSLEVYEVLARHVSGADSGR